MKIVLEYPVLQVRLKSAHIADGAEMKCVTCHSAEQAELQRTLWLSQYPDSIIEIKQSTEYKDITDEIAQIHTKLVSKVRNDIAYFAKQAIIDYAFDYGSTQAKVSSTAFTLQSVVESAILGQRWKTPEAFLNEVAKLKHDV